MTTTIESLIADAITEVDEWIDDHPEADEDALHAAANEIIREQVPPMTTTLFHLVVDDNALAFEDVDTETETTPFNVLFEAVAQKIGQAVREHLESKDDE